MNPEKYVQKTQQILANKVNIFSTFPVCIENIIKYKLWSKVKNKDDNYFKSFKDLCESKLPYGLDLDIEDDLLIYLKDTPEVKKLVLMELEEQNNKEGMINNPIGSNQYKKSGKSDNITLSTLSEDTNKPTKKKTSSNRGTSKTYILKRLKRDNPELADKLINEEVTANEAAEIAGIRKKFYQVRSDNIELATLKLITLYEIDLFEFKEIVDKFTEDDLNKVKK